MLSLLLQAGGLLAVTFLLFSYLGWWVGTRRDKRRPVVHVLTLSEETQAQEVVAEAEEVTVAATPSEEIRPFMDGAAVVDEAETQPQTAEAEGVTDEAVAAESEPGPVPVQPARPIAPPRPAPGNEQTVAGRLHIDPTPRGLQRQPEPQGVVTAAVIAPEKAADDLTRISGISAFNEKELNALGIFRYQQIADLTPRQREEIFAQLRFPMRAVRENWVKQAAKLSEKSGA